MGKRQLMRFMNMRFISLQGTYGYLAGFLFAFILLPALAVENGWQHWHRITIDLYARQQFPAATDAAINAYNKSLKIFPLGDSRCVRSKNFLKGLYHYQGRFKEASRLEKRFKALQKQARAAHSSEKKVESKSSPGEALTARVRTGDRFAILELVQDMESGIRYKDKARLMNLFPYDLVSVIKVAPDMPSLFHRKSHSAKSFVNEWVKRQGAFEKKYSNIQIEIEEGLATLVGDYTLQLPFAPMSHGKEIWTLVRTRSGWVITSIAQTTSWS